MPAKQRCNCQGCTASAVLSIELFCAISDSQASTDSQVRRLKVAKKAFTPRVLVRQPCQCDSRGGSSALAALGLPTVTSLESAPGGEKRKSTIGAHCQRPSETDDDEAGGVALGRLDNRWSARRRS